MFIHFLCIFRATMCQSSGETTVFMRHLVLVILCGWLSGIQGHPYIIKSTKCQINTAVSPDDGHIVALNTHRERNKHTKKNCVPSWLYLQDYKGMHGQQNIKLCFGSSQTGVAWWLRRCATSPMVPGSIPSGVTGFFSDIFPSDLTYHGLEVDSAPSENEYQEHSWW
jgi:hypothetical protein